jgi:trehalose synthase-fused probable maltokinase
VTPGELAAKRWFRSKGRPIASVTDWDAASVGPAELRVLEVAYGDGDDVDHYLVPLVGGREPGEGDGAWLALADAMADDAILPGGNGHFASTHTDALRPIARTERALGVEQSNTSVVVGERFILKLYRRLEPGVSPELEIGEFLTRVGFPDTPGVAGGMTWLPHDGEPSAAAMLQVFVPSAGDAWAAMLGALASEPADGIEIARVAGDVTARLHAALASAPSDAFPAREATVAETAAWRASAERQLTEALAAVTDDAHSRMVELAPAVRARFADTFGAAPGRARVSRIHGDLHLGQLLARADGGLSVIDFEGEPARPLVERRAPSSPLRDVAGLLRSLDYAARTAAADGGMPDPDAWLARARDALLAGYGGVDATEMPLLAAFELEKACYEVRYEASNRPDWLWLPIAAVERLSRY